MEAKVKIHQTQEQFNDLSQDKWHDYTSHRQRVTELSVEAVASVSSSADDATLCVLGAGNGNDLDLEELAKHFKTIHLVDIDGRALERIGDRYQNDPKTLQQLVFEPPVDVTSVSAQLETFAMDPTEDAARNLERSAKHPPGTPFANRAGTFDVVVSCCLLTQLIASVLRTVGGDSPFYVPLVLAIREGHLRTMMKLSKDGGRCVLVTDFVSSDTLPAMVNVDAEDAEKVRALARMAIEQRNFFTGGNPFAAKENIERLFAESAPAGDLPTVEVAPPWRWQIGERFYLVTALSFPRD